MRLDLPGFICYIEYLPVGVSPSGKAMDSDSIILGSNPSTPAIRSHRLAVRTPAFHVGNRGSSPLGITTHPKQQFLSEELLFFLFLLRASRLTENGEMMSSLEMRPASMALPRLLLLAAYTVVILWLSLTPAPPSAPEFLGWDKLQHAGAFAFFAFLAGWAFTPLVPGRAWCWGMALAIACGALVEIFQALFTKTRNAEFGDLVADAAGAGVVWLAMAIRGRLRKRSFHGDEK